MNSNTYLDNKLQNIFNFNEKNDITIKEPVSNA